MKEALGAGGHGLLEQHDALVGLVAEELQGREAAGRAHVEVRPAANGYDNAFALGGRRVRVLPSRGIRVNVGTMRMNVHESGGLPFEYVARARFPDSG